MNYPSMRIWRICLFVSTCLVFSAMVASASDASGPDEPQVVEQSGGLLSWLTGMFSVSPEEREEREAALRAKADARAQEFAEAIEAATDEEEKARLERLAEQHAGREEKRRAAVEQRARRDAERLEAAEARQKAREEERARAEQERKERAAEAERKAAERQEAREAELKARVERQEREQAERAAALAAQLKAREEARAQAEAEARAREEQAAKERVEAAKAAAAERRAREEARVEAELERRAAREAELKERMEASAKELADAVAAAEDPKEKARLQREAEELAEQDARRRAAFAAREADIKARWEARSRVLEEREKRELELAATPPERSKWRLSAGAIHRTINSQTFKTDSYSQEYPIPAKSRNTTYIYNSAGDTVSYTERNYIDGYVHKDQWTDLDGGTWNWGYDSGSQVGNDTLALRWLERSQTRFTRDISVMPGEREKESDSNSGIYIRAERVLKQAGPFDYGLRLDASRVGYSSSGNFMTFRDRQEWVTFRQYAEDSYSLAGTGITPASQPYQGDLNTPGPSIDNTPDSRRRLPIRRVSSGSYEAFNSVDESLDVDLSTLSLGISIAGHYNRFFVAGATGPTLTMADTDASYHESLYESSNGEAPLLLSTWSDKQRDTEYNVGFFIQGELGLRLIKGLELSIFGRYDWIENISGSVGRTRYVINPEGGSVGGTVNYAF